MSRSRRKKRRKKKKKRQHKKTKKKKKKKKTHTHTHTHTRECSQTFWQRYWQSCSAPGKAKSAVKDVGNKRPKPSRTGPSNPRP